MVRFITRCIPVSWLVTLGTMGCGDPPSEVVVPYDGGSAGSTATGMSATAADTEASATGMASGGATSAGTSADTTAGVGETMGPGSSGPGDGSTSDPGTTTAEGGSSSDGGPGSTSGPPPGGCMNDLDCLGGPPLCGPTGMCQYGNDGDPCANDNDCNVFHECCGGTCVDE